MADSAILDLDPRLQPFAAQFLTECAGAGLKVRITVTWRNAADQDAAHDKGLSNAGAGASPHNCCTADGSPAARAFDFALFDGSSYIADGTDDRYAYAGIIAERIGLAWGGRWHHPDYDHVELANWKALG